MPQDRSIRNIPLPSNNRRPAQPYIQEELPPSRPNVPPPRIGLPKKRSRAWVWALLILLLCAVAGLLLSTVFEGATVTITRKTAPVPTPQTLTAVPNGPAGTLSYQTLTANQTATTSVAQSGTQQVSRPATGVVTIYNAYSTAPQELVATTRLSTSDGTIYRIKTDTTVPGATEQADGTLSPGSVSVSAYADVAGADANTTGPVQMQIVGFKGTPRYDAFSAESQGPFTGGFVGEEPAVASADLATAQATLKQELDQNIRAAAAAQVPAGFVSVNGSLGATYSDISETAGPNNTVLLSQEISATLAIMRGSDVAAALAKEAVSGYNGEAIDFADPSTVTISLATSTSGSVGPLSLSVGGTPTLVWQLNSDALAQKLLGEPKSQFQTIISQFEPAVGSAEASIRPFWRATFPSDPKKLHIVVK